MRLLRLPTAVALFSTVLLVAFTLLAGAEVALDGGKTGRPRSTERHQQTVQNKTAPSVKDAQEGVESGAVEELWAVSDRGGDDAAMARAPLIVSSASTTSSPIAPKTSTTKRRGPLSRILGMFGISLSAKPSKTGTRGRSRKWRRKKKQTTEEMLYHDITLAFINGLKSGLYDDLEKPLSTERKQLLLDWCDLLSATLPPEFGLHRIISLIRSNWIHISSSRRNLMSILSVSLPAEKDYSDACTQPTKRRFFGGGAGSNSKSPHPARGSTCAFWRLLHTLSVGLAERKGGTDAATDDEVAADIIRNVVDNFFACGVCRKAFVDQYDQCQYGRCEKLQDTTDRLTEDEWREMSLWLWQHHNSITSSIITKGSAAKISDEKSKSVSSGHTWPSTKDCPSCQSTSGTWDQLQVYQYLRHTYWGDEEGSTPPAETVFWMRNIHVLDAKSTLVLVGIIVTILVLIRMWSRRYLMKHNIGYLPLSSHLNGKTSGKKE